MEEELVIFRALGFLFPWGLFFPSWAALLVIKSVLKTAEQKIAIRDKSKAFSIFCESQ